MRRGVPFVALAALTAGLISTGVGAGAAGGSSSKPQQISDSQLQAITTTMGGAQVENTTDTIPHFWSSTSNPNNGVTYGWNMVGANPATCSGSTCDTTVTVDITPVNVYVGGMWFNGSDVLQPTLDSPVFATNDYGSTPAATAAGAFPNRPNEIRGPGGALSQNDAGNLLQLEDATMRAQFNQTGTSPYHLRLAYNVLPAIAIVPPSGSSTLLESGRGVIVADVAYSWWGSRIQNLMQNATTTHLPLYLTNNVLLHIGSNPLNCCVIGFHGAGEVVGHGTGSVNGKSNQHVQTFSWGSWVQPGFYSRANGGQDWALQDIHALSHEISEWADDPFVNNKVEPWVTPTAPQYGCTGVLETGDPVVAIGFAMGSNGFQQGPNPNGSQSADGYYHPEDEVFLPWFMRTSPNTISEPTQSSTDGRYTLMGDLNPFPGFRAPATGC